MLPSSSHSDFYLNSMLGILLRIKISSNEIVNSKITYLDILEIIVTNYLARERSVNWSWTGCVATVYYAGAR